VTQRTQLRYSHHEAVKAKREPLYAEFVDEATRLYGTPWVTKRTMSLIWLSYML
jgi:hypothetical protein